MSKDLKIIRQVKNYSLIKKGRWYYIDDGKDVSEYQDELTTFSLKFVSDEEFIKKCKEFFQ